MGRIDHREDSATLRLAARRPSRRLARRALIALFALLLLVAGLRLLRQLVILWPNSPGLAGRPSLVAPVAPAPADILARQIPLGPVTVRQVIDPATFAAERAGQLITIRVVGLARPDTTDPAAACLAQAAQARATELLAKQTIDLWQDPTGPGEPAPGTLAANPQLPDGRSYAEVLVREGLIAADLSAGQAYLLQDILRRAEREARAANRGLWAIDPCQDRRPPPPR